MDIDFLSDDQKSIALQAMRYADSIFENYALQAVFGISHEHLREVIRDWPDVDLFKSGGAIDNSLIITSSIQPTNWSDWFTVSLDEVSELSKYWISLRPRRIELYGRELRSELEKLSLQIQESIEIEKWWQDPVTRRPLVRKLRQCLDFLGEK